MSSNVPPQVQVVTESAYFVALHFGQTIIRRSRPESNQYPIKPSTTLNGTANSSRLGISSGEANHEVYRIDQPRPCVNVVNTKPTPAKAKADMVRRRFR